MRGLLSTSLIALTLCLAALLPATGVGAPTAPVVPTAVYVSDVNAATDALTRWSTILARTNDVADIKRQRKAVRTAMRTFDRHVYVLSRYRLTNVSLNRQRARLAATGATLSITLSDFIDAVLLEDTSEVSRLAAVATRQSTAFQQAATAS